MDLNEINVFVKVVQAGSFNQAGKLLGMPNSTVSAKVSGLEKRLGLTLLQRTTRKLNLTEEGRIYYQHALAGLEEILKAENEVSATREKPQGRIRVTAPVDMGSSGIAELASEFQKKYPDVSAEFLFTDRLVDLVAEGFDVAIRAGELKDSGMRARKIGSICWAVFASPAYLKKFGIPKHPKDLRQHACVQFSALGEDSWRLENEGSSVTVPLQKRILGNDVNWIKSLTVSGNGIALLPTYLCETEAKSKKLVRILPEWKASLDPIHLVYPAQKFVPAKVTAFSDLALRILKF